MFRLGDFFSILLFFIHFKKGWNKIFQTLEGQMFLSPFSFLHSFFFSSSKSLRISMLFQEGDETEDYLNAIKEKIKAQERI